MGISIDVNKKIYCYQLATTSQKCRSCDHCGQHPTYAGVLFCKKMGFSVGASCGCTAYQLKMPAPVTQAAPTVALGTKGLK